MINSNEYKFKFSILVPTRKRPENIRALVNSAQLTSRNFESLEFLFYLDFDDNTFPSELLEIPNLRIVRGPRIWLPLMLNVLYVHSAGEILMVGADDIRFVSKNWDERVSEVFSNSQDKILLAYGDDLGTYGSKLAIHGFVHRKWIEVIGSLAPSGRSAPTDLWLTEVAKKIDRLAYIQDVKIQHMHYRQGAKLAHFDDTYKQAYNDSSAYRPLLTYKNLERERRIDTLLLAKKIGKKSKKDSRYLFSEAILWLSQITKISDSQKFYISTLDNYSIVKLLIRKFLRIK